MGHKEDHEILRKAGLTEGQIKQLSRFRQGRAEDRKFQELADYRRLQFVRWLVTTGKLTEQVARN